jgi:hypothetical protein
VWVLAGIPRPGTNAAFRYFIIPSKEVARHVKAGHQKWLSEPGLRGQERRDSNVRTIHIHPKVSYTGWDITGYEDRWDMIEGLLGMQR